MYWIYVLKSKKDEKMYVGSTADLEKRLHYHNSGKVRSTKSRRPLEIVYKEQFYSVTDARKRENFLKSGQGRKLLANIIRNF
ncbi:MAG: GIY-YIG nuclease family protein [Candidatus Omnitrophica bacterium]|nr:GIY-YIG nuclease family protein [Candidatus Omnitrophota bacterium]